MEWYQKLRRVFLALGYSICQADEAVFIIADSKKAIALIKKQLKEHFEMTDLGEIKWLLGISVHRNREARTITLGQHAYVDSIVEWAGQSKASVSTTVLPKAQHSLYREAIGRLMYASLATRPDISYAMLTLSRYMQEPRTTHWHATLRVFKYLKGTRDYSLTLGGRNTHVTGYSDADWAQQMHRHSISGYAFFIGSGIVSWSSKKQPVITLSSTESEYVARIDPSICPANHTLLQQSRCHCTLQRLHLPCTNEAYRRPVPFRQADSVQASETGQARPISRADGSCSFGWLAIKLEGEC